MVIRLKVVKAKGKKVISRLKAEINKPANRAKAVKQIETATDALSRLKNEALVLERQAVSYAKKNSTEALVLAVAAGNAAGALLPKLRGRSRRQ